MSLYQLERDGDVNALVDVLHDGNTAEVRRRAAEVLGDLERDEQQVIDGLVRAAQEDEGEGVAPAAIDALDALGGNATEQLVADIAGVDFEDGQADWAKAKAFVRVLDADTPELRMAAANALGRLEVSDAVPELTDAFADADPRVRLRAARACGTIADPRATNALVDLLSGQPGEVRRAAANALGDIGNKKALAALLAQYDDPNAAVRRIAVDGMGNFDSDRPVDALVDALDDESAAVRRTAAFSIIELLSNVSSERSHAIREDIVAALSETDDAVLQPMVDVLEQTTQGPERRNTAWLLGRVAGEEHADRVVSVLVDVLDDDDSMAAQFAATSLAELGGRRVERALLDLLDDDPGEQATAQAVFVLGKVGGEDARERLDSLVDETESDQVRKRAFSAISKLGGRA